jgi:Gp5 N-terminal OB domain
MSQVHNFSFGAFEWFIGKVEGRDDPMKIGRVKIRAYGFYGDDIPVEDLPWAMVMQNITSAAQGGVGTSPTGIQVGTDVVGFFADGKHAQTPIVLGTLAGMPGGKPDTNALARGDELETTVIETKKESVTESRADGNAISASTALQNAQSQITQTISSTRTQLNGLREKFAQVGDLGIMQGLNSISATVTQIASLPAQAGMLRGQIESQIKSVRAQVEILRNLDPDLLTQRLIEMQVGDVPGAIRALQSLDFDSALNTIQNIPVAIGQVERLADAIAKMGDIGDVVSAIKGLAKTIPSVGAINSLARSISAANVWDEPETPAAPEYPMNKIMETEGGHIEEWDDTPEAERYHRYHPSGSFIEVHPDGSQVDKIVRDNYKVILGDDYLHVEGKVQVNIVGNATVVVNGDMVSEVSGNKVEVVKGNYSIAVGGNYSVTSGGAIEQSANSQYAVKAARIDLN